MRHILYGLDHICLFVCLLQSQVKPAPFSDDTEAAIEREHCDYTQKFTFKVAKSGRGNLLFIYKNQVT